MLIGFSKHYGLGGSGPVLGYLTGYLVNGEARASRPEVVRGDPRMVGEIIDTLPFERRYTSGVLSFHAEDRPSAQVQEEIMDRFENTAFAGLPADRRCIVWIRHQDKGRVELHFVVPRLDLGTRKSLNIAPPTPASRHLLDTLRSAINYRYGFADPGDPARACAVSLPAHVAKLAAQAKRHGRSARKDIREEITERLHAQVESGAVGNRAEVVSFLKAQGFAISRAGVNSLTVVRPDTGERVRLKGEVYREHFRPQDLQRTRPSRNPAQLVALEQRLERLVEKRAAYHRVRYEIAAEPVEPARVREEITHDRTRIPVAPHRPATGERARGTRPAVCRATGGLDEAVERWCRASRNLECADQRLGRAHRTFAVDTERKVTAVGNRLETSRLFRKHGIPMTSISRGTERSRGFELELDMELE